MKQKTKNKITNKQTNHNMNITIKWVEEEIKDSKDSEWFEKERGRERRINFN